MSPDVKAVGDGHPVPLRLHVLFHPSSTPARNVALRLFDLLNGPSTDLGLRVPVRFGVTTEDGRPAAPPALDSDRSLVVVLVDERMARSATGADRAVADAWAALVENLLESYQPGMSSSTCYSVLPVALDSAAFTLSDRLGDRSFVRLDANDRRHLEFHVAIGCLRLLGGRPASYQGDVDTMPSSDVELFVSHAKRDLKREAWRGAVAALLTAHNSLPLKAWYDSSDIPVGAKFGQEIDRAVKRASAVIVVLTDSYSSREWCRRELLAAKAAGRPVVVVDAIESQVVRLFPYIGNAPTVRWRAALAEATSPDHAEKPGIALETWEEEDASTVLLITLLEALRYQHELLRLGSSASPRDQVVGTQPEALTVSAVSEAASSILYPDPPLGREELEQFKRARPSLTLVTPLERLAQWEGLGDHPLVAMSLSGAPDVHRYGGSESHLATMAHDIALYLLLSGHRLLYGGMLGHGAVNAHGRAPGDDVNYVERLMELVERHSPLAGTVGRPLQPIEHWLAWPWYEELTEDQRNLYRRNRATLTEVPPPNDLNVNVDELGVTANGRHPNHTSLGPYVRARCLTKLRFDSTAAASARVALGGKLDRFMGLLPGVAEEALITLRVGKPLFLLGAFGGTARAVIDVLRGEDRVEFTSAWCEHHVAGWRSLMDEYRRRQYPAVTPEEAADEMRRRGATGLATATANGLSDEENAELATTTDPWRAVELVLGGLRTVETQRT